MTTALHIFSGDTVRLKATFRDWSPDGVTGALVDPDSNASSITVYDVDLNSILTGSGIRESQGLYYFDWTAPVEGAYFLEFKGMFSGLPQLTRQKFLVKFRPDV